VFKKGFHSHARVLSHFSLKVERLRTPEPEDIRVISSTLVELTSVDSTAAQTQSSSVDRVHLDLHETSPSPDIDPAVAVPVVLLLAQQHHTNITTNKEKESSLRGRSSPWSEDRIDRGDSALASATIVRRIEMLEMIDFDPPPPGGGALLRSSLAGACGTPCNLAVHLLA
jgi:hypothetical protein